jgi:chromosome segregation ATPase
MHRFIPLACLCLVLSLGLLGCGSKNKEEIKAKDAQLEQKDAELKSLKQKFQDTAGLLGQREGELRAVNEALAVVVKERDACQAAGDASSAGKEDPRRLKDELEKLTKKYKDVVIERDRLKRRLEGRP